MASIPSAVTAGSGSPGDKENISEDVDHPLLDKEVAFAAKGRKKPAGFNLRKSIAWNPAFFTEEGVLDNSELSVLTGFELMAHGTPSSGFNGIMSPLRRSGRCGNTSVLKEVAESSRGKLSAKHRCIENQGRRLFSSAKPPQRDERKEPVGCQIRSSARSAYHVYPQDLQKKVPNSTSTTPMSRIPKKPLPMALRSTTPETTVLKSNKNLPPVKTEPIHKVPGLLPKSKIESGPILEKDMVPSVAAIHEEANGSVKLKNSQISPFSFGGTTSTFAKPSALRMPSPSVGFFTQENAHMSHSNSAQRNAGRFSSVNSSSLVKPPRYKQSEDLKTGIHLSKLLSTSSTTASNLISRPVTTDSNTNTLVGSEKRSLSKIISTYSAKSRDANYQERPEVYCLLAGSAGSAATTQPLSSEKNDGARNSMPIVYNDTSHVEGRGIIKEIEPTENSLSLKATCLSTFEVIDDSCSLKATCSIISPIAGSNISSQTSYLSCQSKSDSGSVAEIDLESSCVGERGLAIPMSDGDSCDLDIDSSRNLRSCDDLNTECALMEYTIHADQMTPRGNSSDGMPALADRSSVSNDSLCDEGNSVLSEEANNDGGTELEINNASALTEDPLLQMGPEPNHTYKGTKCSPVQQEAPKTCVERQHALSVEPNMEDEMVSDSYKLPAQDDASHTEKDKAVVDRPRTNTILRDHLKNLVPFTEEWLAVMEACGQEVLEQKSGAVQNSPPDKSAPEPSPWSPVKRKAQDVGPFDCTKYSKSVRTSVSRNCKI